MRFNNNSSYYRNLIQCVIDESDASDWENAVLEWEVFDCEEDETLQSSCVCGKEKLRYLFTIHNTRNGNTLYPIGSSCIKKFERDDLNEDVTIKEQLFNLLHAIENNEFITLSSDLFSRKLLNFLNTEDVFQANDYNGFDSEKDYVFLLKMFNKRDKDSISTAQQRKISAIIMRSIKPYLSSLLKEKVRYRQGE